VTIPRDEEIAIVIDIIDSDRKSVVHGGWKRELSPRNRERHARGSKRERLSLAPVSVFVPVCTR